MTAQSVRKVEPASADVEADGREEPNPGAGRGKGLCCTQGRPAKRLKRVFNGAAFMPSGAGIEVSVCSACGAPMKRRILHKEKRAGRRDGCALEIDRVPDV